MASADIINPQTFNRYVYVGNNPVNITDPTGLSWGELNGNLKWFDGDPTGGYKPYNALVGYIAGTSQLVVLSATAGTYETVANNAEALRKIAAAVGTGAAAFGVSANALGVTTAFALGYIAIMSSGDPIDAGGFDGMLIGKYTINNQLMMQNKADEMAKQINQSSNIKGETSPDKAKPNSEDNKPDTSANTGGGKDGRKSNPDRVASAKQREQDARAELAEINSRRNKVKQDFIDRDKAQKKLNKAISDQKKSEPHGRGKKGS
jgi:hypothetical protein